MGLRWPWARTERRQAPAGGGGGSYTDAIVTAILQTAAGGDEKTSPLVTAAVEAAANLYASAFASADVEGTDLVTPAVLSAMGRDLIRYGESVFLIRLRPMGDGVRLLHAASWDVTGGPDPETWRYQVSIASPSARTLVRNVGAESVVHVMYSHDPNRPWTGVSPIQWASGTGKLLAAVEKVLTDESSGTRGYLLPVPADGADETIDQLKADLAALGGGTALVETTASGWGQGVADSPRSDWMPRRIGPNYPQPVTLLRRQVEYSVMVVCGIPLSLVAEGGAGGLREAWRQFLHGSVAPLGRLIGGELTEKLERPVRLTFGELGLADVMTRGRAFQSLTGGGMSVERAAAATGFTP